MADSSQHKNFVEKIGNYDLIEILINEKKEMVFDRIIDPPYIQLHFERIVKSSRDFDIVKLIGYQGSKSKEVIAEVIVSN